MMCGAAKRRAPNWRSCRFASVVATTTIIISGGIVGIIIIITSLDITITIIFIAATDLSRLLNRHKNPGASLSDAPLPIVAVPLQRLLALPAFCRAEQVAIGAVKDRVGARCPGGICGQRPSAVVNAAAAHFALGSLFDVHRHQGEVGGHG